MSIRYRPMRAADVRECVELISADPIVKRRYGSAIAHLEPVWRQVMDSGGFASSAVVEEITGPGARKVAVGASVFVEDGFLSELKKAPHFWVGPELVKQVLRGKSPLLSAKQVAEANWRGGLNLIPWHGCVRREDNKRSEVWYELTSAFLEYHRGFLLKELAAQAESVEHLAYMRGMGGLIWDPAGKRYREFWENDLSGIMMKPHVVGVTRQLGREQPGSWIGSLFLYEPPRFGFSRSEQRLLLAALGHATDQELSSGLGVSLFTVKKAWRSIYDRVAEVSPDVIPAHLWSEGGTSERGREKKQRLIAYLRAHPEELRPISRTLLKANRPQHRA